MINPSPVNDAAYSYELTITDAGGYSGTAAGDYVVGPSPNFDPVINSAVFTYKSATLLVKVSDPNTDETLSVTVTEPLGLHADSTGKTASSTGPLAASFKWYADDPATGGTGVTTVTVSDGLGAMAQTDVEITIPALGALYAIPQVETASVDEPVTILVTTDAPGYPFQFVSLLSVTVEAGAELVDNSINVGAIGGSQTEADGIWAAMGPSGFTLPSSYMIWQGSTGGDRERWEFFLFPLNGSDLVDETGDLFNFQFTFNAPGTYTLGFVQETDGVARTYYTDGDEYMHCWGDLSNDHEGIPNSIVVTE